MPKALWEGMNRQDIAKSKDVRIFRSMVISLSKQMIPPVSEKLNLFNKVGNSFTLEYVKFKFLGFFYAILLCLNRTFCVKYCGSQCQNFFFLFKRDLA